MGKYVPNTSNGKSWKLIWRVNLSLFSHKNPSRTFPQIPSHSFDFTVKDYCSQNFFFSFLRLSLCSLWCIYGKTKALNFSFVYSRWRCFQIICHPEWSTWAYDSQTIPIATTKIPLPARPLPLLPRPSSTTINEFIVKVVVESVRDVKLNVMKENPHAGNVFDWKKTAHTRH